MKNILYIICTVLLLSGCSFKDQVKSEIDKINSLTYSLEYVLLEFKDQITKKSMVKKYSEIKLELYDVQIYDKGHIVYFYIKTDKSDLIQSELSSEEKQIKIKKKFCHISPTFRAFIEFRVFINLVFTEKDKENITLTIDKETCDKYDPIELID